MCIVTRFAIAFGGWLSLLNKARFYKARATAAKVATKPSDAVVAAAPAVAPVPVVDVVDVVEVVPVIEPVDDDEAAVTVPIQKAVGA
jgi:hypothetical protein